jgi:hypothetical protein
VYTAAVDDEEGWLIGGLVQSRDLECDVIAAVGSDRPLLVDSGALKSVTNPRSFTGRDHDPLAVRKLFDISGTALKHYGKKTIDYGLPSGRQLSMVSEVCDVTRDIMSVAQGNDSGFTYVFAPGHCCMTKTYVPPPPPNKREEMARVNGLFYLMGHEKHIETMPGNLIAAEIGEPAGENALNLEPFDQDAMEAAHEIWEGDLEDAIDVPQAFVPPIQQALAQPRTPTDAEVVWHNQTHLPYESWCTSCQAGKARGHYHIKVPPSEMALPIVQCDYTFWSNEGLELK